MNREDICSLCSLPVHSLPERYLLVQADQAQGERCLLHRTDNQVSRVLAVVAERRDPILQGVDPDCPYCDKKLQDAKAAVCMLRLEEAAGLVIRYLDAMEAFGLTRHALTDQLLADLTIHRLLLSRIESHLVTRGILEERITVSDQGERVTTGGASSLLRTLRDLVRCIREGEQRLMQAAPTRPATDDDWLFLTDDLTRDDAPEG